VPAKLNAHGERLQKERGSPAPLQREKTLEIEERISGWLGRARSPRVQPLDGADNSSACLRIVLATSFHGHPYLAGSSSPRTAARCTRSGSNHLSCDGTVFCCENGVTRLTGDRDFSVPSHCGGRDTLACHSSLRLSSHTNLEAKPTISEPGASMLSRS